MFLGLGVGAFASGIFHVMTHAFFKALLFLGAGAVIHALHDEQDIQRMGGLKSHMPTTSKTFLVAALAIAGIPPLSGFFSKDEILFLSFAQGSPIYWVLGWLGAGLTAFYMFRLYSLTFEGEARWSHDKHPHEAPRVMTIPLIVLAVLSIVGGFVGIPPSLGGSNMIEHWLDPMFEDARGILMVGHGANSSIEYILMILSVAAATAGIYGAVVFYVRTPGLAARVSSRFAGLYRLLFNKYYVDEVYDASVVVPVVKGSEKLLWRFFDVGIVDGLVNGSAKVVGIASSWLRRIQVGVVQSYALIFVVGTLIILWLMISR
jgi:NADH-quinone oxidoreductase subunit L